MKRLVSSTAFLLLWSSIAAAQVSPRDALIDRVESVYLQTTVLSADSPFIAMLLDALKSANRNVSNDTWLAMKPEIAAVVTKVMTEKGGLLDTILRKSMEPLSDAELDKLGQILGDPAYTKFQRAMANPSTQKAFVQAMFGDALRVNAAINSVLVRHGLTEPKAIKPRNAGAAELKQFDFEADTKSQESAVQKPTCSFPELTLPAEFSVFAAGAYSGQKISFQIDQSGHEGTQIDVAVNNPDKPVVLMLGAYEPTIWKIGWSKETKILAVLVGGYHRQAVAGLEKSTPLLVSSYDNKGPCGYFYVTPDNLAPLNPLSKRVFGRPVDMVFPATKGKVVIGEPILSGTELVTSSVTTPESFQDKTAPMAGLAGLEDALRKGLLRKATAADAEAWSDAVLQNSPQRDMPPVAGQGIPKPPKPGMHNAYVVLERFTYPSGLYGGNSATFLIPKGVPKPGGNPGHSAVYDFSTLNCQGALCRTR